VETYFDDGKNGVTLQKRPAMKQVLADLTRPERTFSVDLVLDVTVVSKRRPRGRRCDGLGRRREDLVCSRMDTA
jgi:hypothetical protein